MALPLLPERITIGLVYTQPGAFQLPCTVSVVSPADDGVIGDWSVEVAEDAERGGQLIHLSSPGPPLAFASFGPLVRFDFTSPPPADTPLFEEMYVDNSVYEEGEFLVIRGFHNPDLTAQQEAD